MLDTNTLDYIFNNRSRLAPKLIDLSKKIANFYITRVQLEEIDKITEISKKNCINKILVQMGTRTILTSKLAIKDDNVSQFEFIESEIFFDDIRRNHIDKNLLKKLYEFNPIHDANFADLLILYTAVKNKMDYLITDNFSDFRPLLQKMLVILPTCLQLKKNYELANLQIFNKCNQNIK